MRTLSGVPPRLVLALAIVVALLAGALGEVSPVGAAPSDEISSTTDAYDLARDQLAVAESSLAGAEADRDAAQQALVTASGARGQAEAALADQRDRYGAVSAEYYMQLGTQDAKVSGSMRLAMAGRRQALDRAKVARDAAAGREHDAEKALADRQAALDRSSEQHDQASASAAEAGARADAALVAAGISDLPAIAYAAYQRAAGRAGTAFPACHLPAAVLAGIGRISSSHGRNLGSSIDDLGRVAPALRGIQGARSVDTDQGVVDGDSGGDQAVGPMQLTPPVWTAHATDGDGDGRADPDDVFDAAATTATALCAAGESLDTLAPLDRVVDALLGEGQQSAVVLGAARRYARAAALDMGTVPADPRVLIGDGGMQFDGSAADLAPGDVTGMIGWALTRLGTPYSQCLGPDVRPQDPVCPPGTNRYGSGFFDCSGFVSHAYRAIGILVPATTYAMEADPHFMATQVSDHIDLSVMQPGDVFLMDGHTGMYVGGGMIVHAIGRGLTYEPVPRWVANGTIAVLRPLLLV